MGKIMETPTSAGWWWCIPDPECRWHERYPSGVFVQVEELEGYDFPPDRFCVWLTGTDEVVGLTREHPSDLFGMWCGPITPPCVDGMHQARSYVPKQKPSNIHSAVRNDGPGICRKI